jgi:Beta-propeller repeat
MRRLTIVAFFVLLAPMWVQAQTPLWVRQIGSSGVDRAFGIVTDELGDVYICGMSSGRLDPSRPSPVGGADVLVIKLSSLGTVKWIRQLGTIGRDYAYGIDVDQAGNIYVCGETQGSWAAPSSPRFDAFVCKIDGSGNLLWVRQFGPAEDDVANDIAVDAFGNVYVVGNSELGFGGVSNSSLDAFVAKFDTDGTMLWAKQIATDQEDRGTGIEVDAAGNAYVGGSTWGSRFAPNQGQADALLAKFDAVGNVKWIRQLGWQYSEEFVDVGLSERGFVYLGGATSTLSSGYSGTPPNTFVAKYNGNGSLLWQKESNSQFQEHFRGLAVDRHDNVYAGGFIRWWGEEVVLTKFNANGQVRWATRLNSTEDEVGAGVAVDRVGSVYFTGTTEGSLGGPINGNDDIFLAKYSDVSCYADCDTSTGVGVLDVFDYLCFQEAFINKEPFACDCDAVRGSGVCDIWDFICFGDAFVTGCP